jgi:hypothetical protein
MEKFGVPVGRHRPDTKKRLQDEYRVRHRLVLLEKARLKRVSLREQALNRYGRSCVRCGFENLLALVIDHIDDNGAEERKALGGQNFSGWRFYEYLKKVGWPDGYQTLCANCNMIKEQLRLQQSRPCSSEEEHPPVEREVAVS